MAFVKLLMDESSTFDWHYEDPETEEVFADTKFVLRMLPREESRRLEKLHTKKKRRRAGGPREEELDKYKFADDCLDYCIVGWEGVKGVAKKPDGSHEEIDLPCERKYKMRLAESIKAEIGRRCFGRNANALLDEEGEIHDEEDAQDPPAKTDPPPTGPTPVPPTPPGLVEFLRWEGEEGNLFTCCLREKDEELRQATYDEGGYDCDNCPVLAAREGLTVDDRLALNIYNDIAPVAELGLVEGVFEAYQLALTPDEALGLYRRIGAIRNHMQERASELAAKKSRERSKPVGQ